ncbi:MULTISPECIES: hypothetical protein [Clostridium]|uniref:hypothetical protein n=1 Tax=Clostridium TaxID=1485 RepID=UPI0006C6C520|nr:MULTISPECIES: hypothetical protein [Clostridium]MDU1311506.1 hypothetical protein [Clostridium sp.]MDU1408975.1 hypothetical protein [Clostridium sp.]MDU2283366.1 hypothetical protein [Clostridium sp.]MDU2995383.1 hypothetical protein [Clostridium sp.]CUN78744.1 Uncharacterised protein [Clostridium paraputrificum]
MEFITVEQFQEQPLKVQKTFLDWWKCDYGDLYYYNEDHLEYKDFEIINSNLECDLNGDFDYFKSIGVIPIFTEGQLRKFIEDKLDMKIQCEIHPLTLDYIILVKNNSGNKVWMHTGKEDLLQAYWKVACMIAKEG